MGNEYDSSYRTLGQSRRIDLNAAELLIITGRGTHSRRLGQGSMAVLTHIVVRLMTGKSSVPYDGEQRIGLFGISTGGLRILEQIALDKHRSRVRTILLIVTIMIK